jgi:hypothetical protein
MATAVADVQLARLREWGVGAGPRAPGVGIKGLLAGRGRAMDDPQFVPAQREEMAAPELNDFGHPAEPPIGGSP